MEAVDKWKAGMRINHDGFRILPLTAVVCLLLSVASCDTHGMEEQAFLAEPGPILFVSNESGSMQLYSMEPDGTDVRQLTDDTSAPVSDALWSPDGRRIEGRRVGLQAGVDSGAVDVQAKRDLAPRRVQIASFQAER